MEIDSLELDLEVLEALKPETCRRQPRRPNRHRNRVNPFDLDDGNFRNKYRFSKGFAMKIVDLVRENLSYDPRGYALTPELQVVCALHNWSRHEIQNDTADLHGVSQPVISKTCKKIAGILAQMSHRFIKMPATLDEQERVMRKFRSIANFPRVIGAIGCSHIGVRKMRADINGKGFSSISVQVVCDADLKIMDIVTRWHETAHDSKIFRECRLKQRFEAGAFSGLLLGDSGYPCTSCLFTPLLNPRTEAEQCYNNSHIHTRNTIERCFGLWKQRFRCLLRKMYGDLDTVLKTIVACAVLHNIAIEMGEELYPGEGEENSNKQPSRESKLVPPCHITNTLRGNIKRRQFIETHFS